jgi:hypothetical protein
MTIDSTLPQYEDYVPLTFEDGPSSPPYSQGINEDEHALAPLSHVPLTQPLSLVDSDSHWSSAHSYCYPGSLLSVSLGRRLFELRQPAYGSQGLVEGTIKLSRKCTHVHEISVTVGTVIIVHSHTTSLTP